MIKYFTILLFLLFIYCFLCLCCYLIFSSTTSEKLLYFGIERKLPVRVDDLAEGQLTTHLQVTLVLWKLTAGAL